MKWLGPTLIVLSPALLYRLALVSVAIWRGRCRRCQRRGVKQAGGYRRHGKQGGGIVLFYLCEKCGARFRKQNKERSGPSDQEWNRGVHAPTQPK